MQLNELPDLKYGSDVDYKQKYEEAKQILSDTEQSYEKQIDEITGNTEQRIRNLYLEKELLAKTYREILGEILDKIVNK